MWGLRLNLGLVYYRQEQYANALPEFELALKLNAKSTQARYLLGLCDFYTQRYRETVQVLQPLWQTRTNDFVYMYVLGTSASQVGMTELEDRAFLQLAKLGTDTAEFHLLIGRAYLNRFEPDKAAVEFEQAATLKPDLPLLHFNLGVAYLRQHQYARAEEELKEEIKLEPEVAYAYDQLGLTYERMERPDEALRMYKEAIKRNQRFASPHFGLAKIYDKQGQTAEALQAINVARDLAPNSANVRFLRARLLQKVGKKDEANKEFAAARSAMNAGRQDAVEERVPGPEIRVNPGEGQSDP